MKVGFLPLYIELYDKVVPHQRTRHEAYCDALSKKMEDRGVQVVRTEICRIKPEFEKAVEKFEQEDVDAIVTVHLAYSPSGEYFEVLSKTKLPIIVFDTTVTNDMSDRQSPDEVAYCHGIHGVMDMCCMLKRNGKSFAICAGHSDDEKVLNKLIGYIKAASSAKAFIGSSVGMVGTKFSGMEDFTVPEEVLSSRFGIKVIHSEKEDMLKIASQITDAEIEAEIENELKLGKRVEGLTDETFRASAKTCCTLRKWIAEKGVDALTVNFLDVTEAGLDTMPFMEAGLAMQRGTGYAGEGDVFTASLVGALLKNYKETSFIEIFCPDWANNSLMLSHMGEMNYAVAGKEVELYDNPFIYGNGTHTVKGTSVFKGGEAVFVNMFPTKDDFGMVIAPVTMLEETTDNFCKSVRGWMKPTIPVTEFLEKISIEGVTHHSALVYGATAQELAFFAQCLGISVTIID